MIKLKLTEIKALASEVFGIKTEEGIIEGVLLKEIPFPLKFRIETKLIPLLDKANTMINKETLRIASENGAITDDKGNWSFTVDDKGELVDLEKFENFKKEISDFLNSEDNSVEIEFTIRLSLLSGLKDAHHFPILCKIIEDDLN